MQRAPRAPPPPRRHMHHHVSLHNACLGHARVTLPCPSPKGALRGSRRRLAASSHHAGPACSPALLHTASTSTAARQSARAQVCTQV